MKRRTKSHIQKAAEPAIPPDLDLAKSHIAGAFKNRIVGYDLVDPKTIKRNPLNWRTHPESQRATMRDALEQLGFVDTCIVSRRSRMLIDGEMRLDLAIENNEPTVPVLWVELDAEEEKLALAIINPMGELAGLDPEKLQRVLHGRTSQPGPLDDLLRELQELADSTSVKAVHSKPGETKVGPKRPAGHTLRLVLNIPQANSFERAIALTGIVNRGDAIEAITAHYIATHDHTEKRQQHGAAKGGLAAQLEEAVRVGTARRS